jgi:hypothetical protein
MQASEIIPTIAEIAVGIAGFSAIIVVLSPKPIRSWRQVDQLNFRGLLQVAAVTIVFSFLPFAIDTIAANDRVWKISLLIYATYHVIDLATFTFRFPKDAGLLNRLMLAIGYSVAGAQLYFGLTGSQQMMEFIYLVALIWHLSVSFLMFVLLIYSSRNQDIE